MDGTKIPVKFCKPVETEQQLAAWVDAWSETPPGSNIFVCQLLEEESVKFLSVEREGAVVAGMATNLSDGVIGISNAFGEPRDILACIRYCVELHSSRAVVGYGSPAEIQRLRGFGFSSLGNLRIWLKPNVHTVGRTQVNLGASRHVVPER